MNNESIIILMTILSGVIWDKRGIDTFPLSSALPMRIRAPSYSRTYILSESMKICMSKI